jgi:NAD(P)-dependent dehydrogenase (short-subunit alcohol dehydrogenase family)
MGKAIARVAILGAGRGLGLALAHQLLQSEAADAIFLLSKHAERARPQLEVGPNCAMTISELDFTVAGSASVAMKRLAQFGPSHIWYVAGGGPFGAFEDKQWKDHLWAFQLNLLFPLELFHLAHSSAVGELATWQQWVFVGSAIAESRPEINGLAYGAAKCGLQSAWQNWQAENADPVALTEGSAEAKSVTKGAARNSNGKPDVRLYSPGYIDTGLLPPQAWPRQAGHKIQNVTAVAEDFIKWSFDISQKNQHRTFGV